MNRHMFVFPRLTLFCVLLMLALPVRAEVILQYFQMPWRSLTQKMPELAEAGYNAMWLPPPTKASGGLSVGYDLWDPFDLGSKDQRGTVRTFYGTEAELHEMMRTAHRFGIRVYFDNIMNHRAFDVPGFNESTPLDIYPGMLPEDFHLRVTEDGFYRKWDNTRDWNDVWQVLHLGLSDLIDIAHEVGAGGWNHNHGPYEGAHHPGLSFVRHPDNPEYYAYDPEGNYVGFGNVTQEMLDNNPEAYTEDVNAYLIRAVRWKMDRTKADGLRLDAVKHVPPFFFGEPGNDASTAGYVGGMQLQFNKTRGFNQHLSGSPNYRETVFNTKLPRNDAMVFGEHLGEPPGFGEYISRGMRLKDAPLRDHLNGILGSPWGTLSGMDETGWNPNDAFANGHQVGVQFAHSHDSDFAAARELQYAFYMTRAGLPIVYTDGNFKAGTLQDAGGAFPRHANTAFLGQFGDNRLPNLAYVNEHFARGYQYGRWSDEDVVAYARVDKRDEGWGVNDGMDDRSAAVMLFMMNDNYADGQSRPINPVFGHESGVDDAYLMNYSTYGGPFYVWASEIANGNVTIPPGGYFIFSWRSPEPARQWTEAGGNALEIRQDGEIPGTVSYLRRDGPDGDAQFNPHGLEYRGFDSQEEADANPYRYRMTVPRVTSGTNLTFRAHVDGSAYNVLMKLNGGVDLNHHLGMGESNWGNRDRSPGNANDTFLGWEDTEFDKRIWPEKFASTDSSSNKVGSAGATSYQTEVGTGSFDIFESDGDNDFSDANNVLGWVWHNPDMVGNGDLDGTNQYRAVGGDIHVLVKTPKTNGIRPFLYYTTNGVDWPEGGGGYAANNGTRVVEGSWAGTGVSGNTDWFEFTLTGITNGTPLRYKIGASRQQGYDGNDWDVPFPNHPDQVARKYDMMGVWQITNFNAETIEYFPHNDYAQDLEGNPIMETGLQEGMNFIQVRAFLQRDDAAPIYNTFKQTFYLDLERPTGEIKFPTENETLPSQEYGVVVRTDPTVTEVWFNIEDSDPGNDSATHGNGTNELGEAHWAQASEVTPSLDVDSDYEREWRFTYRNIPSEGQATVRVLLRELSSSTNLNLTEEEGHYTILERNVTTDAPELRFFFDWPTEDGQVLEEGWTMRVHFEESLGFGIDDETLLDRFLIRINGSPQPRDAYNINRSIGGGLGSLEYDMPQLYNGDSEFDHLVEVTHVTGDDITLQTTRSVRAAPVPLPPNLVVVDPEQFDSNGRQTEIFLPAMPDPEPEDRQYTIRVDSDPEIKDVWIEFANDAGSASLTSGPVTNDNNVSWFFTWSNMTARTYTFTAYGAETPGGEPVNSSLRTIPVRIRQLVEQDGSGDSDNDGIPDDMEVTQVPLPEQDSEFWNTGDVHIHLITGRTDPLMPISDGSKLPDGLQLGLTAPLDPGATDLEADTNGDGFPNFIRNLDPPLYNTFDNNWHPDFREFAGRMDQITGSMTDPSRADTSGSGLEDHEEDLNRNGRVDIGLLGTNGKVEAILMHPNIPTVYNTSRVDLNRLPSNARLLETDPNSSDTIGDGLLDGQGDVSRNGRVNMYLLHSNETTEELDYTDWNGDFFQFNLMPDDLEIIYWDNNNPPDNHLEGMEYAPIMSRAVDYDALFAAYDRDGTGTEQSGGWPKLLITETDPLAVDTIGDGLPDGWKVRYGLDPLDDGVYNWATGEPGDPVNGPDGDITGDGFTNMDHFLNGTDPRQPIEPVPPPEGTIVIGPGEEIGEVDGTMRFREFVDWNWDDLRAMDAYDGDGSNHRGGDIFRAWDGWDDSRDMVAFYSRDGGDPLEGGSGRVYFRVDFHDLQAYAEQGEVDLYVAINFGDTIGERVLPDEVDTLTEMRWRVVVAVYESSIGQVYVDMDSENNSNVFGDDIFVDGGVEMRPEYYLGAYFNSELDAVEFAIDRQALIDAGWSGANPADLRFQVYTTKSGTGNDPQGPGDIGGRSDIRDSIFNDYIAESHHSAQAGLQGAGSVLHHWIPGDHRGGRAKVALVIHGNQQIRPGSQIQDLINNNAGAGYFRPIDAHEVFGVPLNLHITPTLATAMQWAKADPGAEEPWRDGPSFNARLGALMNEGIISPFATTFSDHIAPYFTSNYTEDSVALAHEFLNAIYGYDMSQQAVFYPPERILDNAAFDQISQIGYDFTLVDQMMHIWHWVSREAALGQDGYRINRFNGVNTFAINDRISTFRFQAHDGGAPMALRRQLNQMARSGTQDQVLIIHSSWEDFLNADNAAAYDALVRWLANRAWVEVVTLEEIAAGEVDVTGDGEGDDWYQIDRGASADSMIGQDWIQYATLGDYGNWYDGWSPLREGLSPTEFEVRPGGPTLDAYGRVGFGGIVDNAWSEVGSVNDNELSALARGVMHASTFVTAFHEQEDVDLSKFSIGTYINPDTDFRSLASFARNAAAQTRRAAIYARVDQWADTADTLTETVAVAEDIDLDGEDEFLIYNQNVFAVLERTGGRMIGAWVRNPADGRVFQTMGNFLSYSGSDTEYEGAFNVHGDGRIEAFRTSGLKDWWAGTIDYVNQVYSAAPAANGWTLTSDDGSIAKTITLDDTSNWFEVNYSVDPSLHDGILYVRHGFSPDLHGLLLHGQEHLSDELHEGGVMTLEHARPNDVVVAARLAYGDGYSTGFNVGAGDDDPGQDVTFSTVRMRNQAQTHQVEVVGTNNFSFAIGFEVSGAEQHTDGVPHTWLEQYYPDPATVDVQGMASNQVNTIREAYIAGISPVDPNAFFRLDEVEMTSEDGVVLRWSSVSDRMYHIRRSDDLMSGTEGFVGIATNLPATPPQNIYEDTDAEGSPTYFYQIGVEYPGGLEE